MVQTERLDRRRRKEDQHNLPIGEIKAGMVITGFQRIEELDRFAKILQRTLIENFGKNYSHYRGNLLERPISDKCMQRDTRGKVFYGGFKNIQVFILPVDQSLIENRPETVTPENTLTFLVQVDRHTTGTGYETMCLECTMYARLEELKSDARTRRLYTGMGARAINSDQEVKQLLGLPEQINSNAWGKALSAQSPSHKKTASYPPKEAYHLVQQLSLH